MKKEDSEKIKVSKKLMKILMKNAKVLSMSDWELKLTYNPKSDNDVIMDVETDKAEYKVAKITVYKLKKDKELDDCFIHELLHLKTATLLKHYTQIIDSQSDLLKDLASLHEERLMEDLTGVIRKCMDKKV